MSLITSLMGLIAWDLGNDYYSHTQLASNFQKIDGHDHTSSKGKQIPSGGLADGAITTSKIATSSVTSEKIVDNSIGGSKIVDGSIGTNELADGSVTGPKLASGAITKDKLDPNIVPVGTVISWYRPTTDIPLPLGWEVCDGRAWSGIQNAWGITTGTIPDLTNRFVLGAGLYGTGTDVSTPPSMGQVGGGHAKNLSHAHTVFPHAHFIPQHAHSIGPDGAHRHRWPTTVWDGAGNPVGTQMVDALQRGSAVKGAEGSYQAMYIGGLNRNEYYGEQVSAPMETTGEHSHGSTTGNSNVLQSSDAAPNTYNALEGSTDIRPAYVGLLFLMRVI